MGGNGQHKLNNWAKMDRTSDKMGEKRKAQVKKWGETSEKIGKDTETSSPQSPSCRFLQ